MYNIQSVIEMHTIGNMGRGVYRTGWYDGSGSNDFTK